MYDDFGDGEQTLDDLRRAIEQALLDSDLLDEQMRQQLQQMQMEGTLDELIEQLMSACSRKITSASISRMILRGNRVWAGRWARRSSR